MFEFINNWINYFEKNTKLFLKTLTIALSARRRLLN